MAPPMVANAPVLSRRCWRSMTCGQEGVGEAHGGIYRHNQQQPHRVLIMSFVTSVWLVPICILNACVTHARILFVGHTLTLVYKMNEVDIFEIIELIRVVLDHIVWEQVHNFFLTTHRVMNIYLCSTCPSKMKLGTYPQVYLSRNKYFSFAQLCCVIISMPLSLFYV